MAYAILIVDNSEDWRQTLHAIFKDTDAAYVAGSVAQAEELLAEHSFDVILLDMVLNMDSGSHISIDVQLFLEALQVRFPNVPVVAITGQPLSLEEAFGLRDLGIRELITKSGIVVSALRQRIKQVIEGARLDSADGTAPPSPGTDSDSDAFIGVLDMRGSTTYVVGNPTLSHQEKMRYLELVFADIRGRIQAFARVTQFFGDGIQFIVPAARNSSGENICRVLAGLPSYVATLADRNEEVKTIVQAAHLDPAQFRVALAYGKIHLGNVVSGSDVMGLPAVHATRVCGRDDLYQQAGTTLLTTQPAYNEGTRLELWQAADFGFAAEAVLHGLPAPIRLYKPTSVG